jgi:tetratricopeptide (TPR) repeat protein
VIPFLLALAAVQTAPAATPVQAPNAASPAAQAPAPTASPPASPEEIAAQARYGECTALVRSEPQRAIDTANAWRLQGGGLYPRMCLGLAYVALGRWAPAATVYEQAAQDADRLHDSRRADFLVQAGNAWLAGGEATRAINDFDAALATANLTDQLRGEVHVDRARALVALNNLAGARENLDRAMQLVPSDPFAWYMSAALARRESNLARAQTDIARAMQLAPDNPDVALLGGTIAGLAGNMTEAERLYRQVADGAPNTEAGRAARASLETLREVEVPAPASGSPATGTAPSATTAPAPAAAAPAAPQPRPQLR